MKQVISSCTHTHGSLERDQGPWNVAGVCSHLPQGAGKAEVSPKERGVGQPGWAKKVQRDWYFLTSPFLQ